MGDVAALKAAYAEIQQATYWQQYVKAYSKEAGQIGTYVNAVIAGANPTPPSLTSHMGRGYLNTIVAGFKSTAAPLPPVIDDMRAIHMQAMSSVGAVVNPDGSPLIFATVATPPSPPNSGLSLTVQSGQAAGMPPSVAGNVLTFPFDVNIGGEEIKVIGKSGDTLQILRGQYGTAPVNITAGMQVKPSDTIIVRTQTPNKWDSLLETNNDITLVPDDVYGQMYRFRTNGNSRNPYWSSSTTCNASLEKHRTITMGQFDWYWFAIMWEPGWDWNKVDWSVFFQFGYPTITSPPYGIYAGGDELYVETIAGLVSADNPYPGYDQKIFDTHSKYINHRLEFGVGIKWGSHKDGEHHLLTRCKDLGETAFKNVIDETGVDTWQWGGASSVPQDPQNFLVVDKVDSYWGYKPGTTDANAPTTYVRHTGHIRCADKATMLAYAGA